MVQRLLMIAPGFICILKGEYYTYDMVNEQYQPLFGKRPLTGKPLFEALPELAGQGFEAILKKVYHNGETYVSVESPIILARDENTIPEMRYFNLVTSPCTMRIIKSLASLTLVMK